MAYIHTIISHIYDTKIRRRLKNLRLSLKDQFLEVKYKLFLECVLVHDIHRQLHELRACKFLHDKGRRL